MQLWRHRRCTCGLNKLPGRSVKDSNGANEKRDSERGRERERGRNRERGRDTEREFNSVSVTSLATKR